MVICNIVVIIWADWAFSAVSLPAWSRSLWSGQRSIRAAFFSVVVALVVVVVVIVITLAFVVLHTNPAVLQ